MSSTLHKHRFRESDSFVMFSFIFLILVPVLVDADCYNSKVSAFSQSWIFRSILTIWLKSILISFALKIRGKIVNSKWAILIFIFTFLQVRLICGTEDYVGPLVINLYDDNFFLCELLLKMKIGSNVLSKT